MAVVNEIQRFLALKSADLKKYLRDRSVPVNDEKHGELAEKAFWAEKLGLTVKPTDEEADQEIQQQQSQKLVLDGGLVHLPRPETLTDGWEDGPSSLPETSRDDLDSYIKAGNRRIGLKKTEGKRTLKAGKGLFMSGHIRGLQYHGISTNLNYCFVQGKVIPEMKTTEADYRTWVVLQKETGQVCTADCSCIVGVQATCKHIAGLLFAVVEAVEGGRNATCTSQKQAWGKAPKKVQSIHQPKFAKDIEIVRVREDVSQQSTDRKRLYRSDFDPRLPAHRVDKPITSFNLDWLATITGGYCGVLAHSKLEHDESRQEIDIDDLVREEIVTTSQSVPTVLEAFNGAVTSDLEVDPDDVIEKLKVTKHQQAVLSNETSSQAGSTIWKEQRIGRVTASVAGDCIGCVRNGAISGQSQIARVMGYYRNASSPAMSWGKNNENIARKQYIAHHRLHNKHTGIVVTETGLWIHLECPYIAASPDGIVSCNQCGRGLLEIKNPYTHRLKPIKELACQKGAFLTNENGIIQLKRTHAYYSQIQMQLWCCGYQWCDFVVRTISKSDNLFVERFIFDMDYITAVRPKLGVFFKHGIVPELITGAVKKDVRDRAVKKTMESMLATLESSDTTPRTEFPCGVCGEVCLDKPDDIEEYSICCDNCDRWFHYICAGIQGNENFLKKRKKLWKCDGCKPKRRVRRKMNSAK